MDRHCVYVPGTCERVASSLPGVSSPAVPWAAVLVFGVGALGPAKPAGVP